MPTKNAFTKIQGNGLQRSARPFYEFSFDIRYLTVQLNEDLNTTRHTTLKVLYIMTPFNCTKSTDNQIAVIKRVQPFDENAC